MTKVFLLVVIVYANGQPIKQYHEPVAGIDECHAREIELYQTIPSNGVVKYFLGCSFEEPAEFTPVKW
jgi:hypothetical protein